MLNEAEGLSRLQDWRGKKRNSRQLPNTALMSRVRRPRNGPRMWLCNISVRVDHERSKSAESPGATGDKGTDSEWHGKNAKPETSLSRVNKN